MDWYPFKTELYRLDTRHLTTLEHGAYRLLIDEYMTTRQPLPDDDRVLASIAKMQPADWLVIAPTIRAFFRARKGYLVQPRCDRELTAQDTRAKSRSEIAQKAAMKRWNINNDKDASSMPDACPENAGAMPADATRQDKTKTRQEEKDISPEKDFPAWYAVYPKHVGRGAALKAYCSARKGADHETLVAGAIRYAGAINGTEPRFIKHPATWLNSSCWLDEETPAASHAATPRSRERRGPHHAFYDAAAAVAYGNAGDADTG